MRKGKKIFLIICMCLIYTGLPGCKTTRKSIRLFNKRNAESVERVKESLIKKKIDVKYIWVKRYNCEIRENWKRKDFYGDIKIVKDERIVITVKSGIGIETARILLTQDSVKIVDRMNKEVFCGGYEQMKRYFGLIDCYKRAEDLLISNNSMVIEEIENKNGKKYDIRNGENNNEIIIYEIGVKKRRNKKFTIGVNNYNIIEYLEKDGEIEMLKVTYLKWSDIGKIKFPNELKIEVHKNSEKSIAIIKYERIEINGKINIKFRIPDGYKVIDL
ncbi:MAG: DUF4292 domain-containing protein [Bacteroidetes bacterium]|nr:DUF4292 domain-containing protein [Bacteroidota bacterium]